MQSVRQAQLEACSLRRAGAQGSRGMRTGVGGAVCGAAKQAARASTRRLLLLLLFGSLDCCLLNFIKPFQNANERTHRLPR